MMNTRLTDVQKQALRDDAIRAGGGKWRYVRSSLHSRAYITDENGSTVINCTAGDVPANCASFLESAHPAAVLLLLDEVAAKDAEIQEYRQASRERDACTHGAVDNEDGVITCRSCGKEWNV